MGATATATSPVSLPEPPGRGANDWPMEIRALLGSLQTQAYCPSDRRRGGARWRYEVEATLWYRDEEKQVHQTQIYTRDASARGIAFVAQLNFKAGQSVIVELPSKSGLSEKYQGHIRRCRQFRDGWFEGVVLFPGGPNARS